MFSRERKETKADVKEAWEKGGAGDLTDEPFFVQLEVGPVR